jgi:hypothetical protein
LDYSIAIAVLRHLLGAEDSEGVYSSLCLVSHSGINLEGCVTWSDGIERQEVINDRVRQ